MTTKRKLHPALGTPLFVLLIGLVYLLGSLAVAMVAAVDIARQGLDVTLELVVAWCNGHILLTASVPALAAIPVAWLVGGWLAGLSRDDLGLRRGTGSRALILGLALGLAAMVVPAAIGRAIGWMEPVGQGTELVSGGAAIPGIAFALPALLVMAFAEEILFRGFLLRYWQPVLGLPGAVILTAIAFALLHGGNPGMSVMGLVGVAVAGVMLAVAFVASESLWFATGIHLGWNAATSLVLGLPVSGLELPSLLRWQTADNDTARQLMGGDFGPEEGLLFHLSLTATLVVALLLARQLRPRREHPPEAPEAQ